MSLAVQGMNIVLPSGGAGGWRSARAARPCRCTTFVRRQPDGCPLPDHQPRELRRRRDRRFGVAAGLLAGDATLAVTLLPGILALLVIVAVFALPALRASRRVRRTLEDSARERTRVPAGRRRSERGAAALRRPPGDHRCDRILRLRRRRPGGRLSCCRSAGLPIGLLGWPTCSGTAVRWSRSQAARRAG